MGWRAIAIRFHILLRKRVTESNYALNLGAFAELVKEECDPQASLSRIPRFRSPKSNRVASLTAKIFFLIKMVLFAMLAPFKSSHWIKK